MGRSGGYKHTTPSLKVDSQVTLVAPVLSHPHNNREG
jgi:hypothetical protein